MGRSQNHLQTMDEVGLRQKQIQKDKTINALIKHSITVEQNNKLKLVQKLNQIERHTLNIKVADSRLKEITQKVQMNNDLKQRLNSAKLGRLSTISHSTSLSNVANMMNKIHFDKLRHTNSKNLKVVRERVKQQRRSELDYGLNTLGSLAQKNLIQ